VKALTVSGTGTCLRGGAARFLLFLFLALMCCQGLAQESRLIATVQQLRCADNAHQARLLVDGARQLPLSKAGLPIEFGDVRSYSYLAAGSFELLLSALIDSADSFPELKPHIRRTLSQWNYCPIANIHGANDVRISPDGVVAVVAAYSPPTNWSGFTRAAALLRKGSHSMLSEKSIYHSSSLQCLTEFSTRSTVNADRRLRAGPTRLRGDKAEVAGSWVSGIHDCQEKTTELPASTNPEQKPTERQPRTITFISPKATQNATEHFVNTAIAGKETLHTEVTGSVSKTTTATVSEPTEQWATTVAAGKAIENPPPTDTRIERVSAAAVRPDDSTRLPQVTFAETFFTESRVVEIPAVLEAEPDYEANLQQNSVESPVFFSGSGHSRISRYTSMALSRFSGTLYINTGVEDGSSSVGADVTLKPLIDSYWFARIGASATAGSDTVGYRWGIGYDDWHPGTWFIQLNNWGPISADNGLDLENAVFSAGYKFRFDLLERLNITSSAAVISTAGGVTDDRLNHFEKNASANLTLQWTPVENWFVRASFDQQLDGGPLRWSYVFGRYNWRANQLNFEYANYSQGRAFESNFEKGTIGISYNLKF
jgi:hypothetical protein